MIIYTHRIYIYIHTCRFEVVAHHGFWPSLRTTWYCRMNLMNPKSSDVFPDPNSLQVTIFGQSAGAASVAWVNPFVILKPTAMIKGTLEWTVWKRLWYQKKVKCCYWTLIYSTTINGSTGARSCWPLTIPLNQSFDNSVNQQDCSISQPTTRWLTHFLTHSITQSTTQWIN